MAKVLLRNIRKAKKKQICKAKTGSGKPCDREVLKDSSACGYKSHQQQVEGENKWRLQ